MLTLLTTFGLKHNSHSIGLVEEVLTFWTICLAENP